MLVILSPLIKRKPIENTDFAIKTICSLLILKWEYAYGKMVMAYSNHREILVESRGDLCRYFFFGQLLKYTGIYWTKMIGEMKKFT